MVQEIKVFGEYSWKDSLSNSKFTVCGLSSKNVFVEYVDGSASIYEIDFFKLNAIPAEDQIIKESDFRNLEF